MLDHKQTTKPQFTWHKVDTLLRIKQSDRFIKIPLRPNSFITINNETNPLIEIRLHIDIEKSLQYEDNIGWNWHKSSRLPIFSLKLSIINSQTGTSMIPPKLQAKIYAVKIVQNTFEKGEKIYLENIGLKGETHVNIQEGCGTFSSLRFCSTSYNNEGMNFHLLIVVYNNQNNSEIPENIICSVMSPPIFVDSRKSARNYQVLFMLWKEKKYLSFVELFNPNELQKQFVKGDIKEDIEEKKMITNSDEGLYKYLTAPNIRHKVKHPLFLAVKFSKAFNIYVNTNSKYFRHKQITLDSVINRLQKKLIKEVGTIRRQKNSQNIQQKQFIIDLVFQIDLNQREKVIQMLEYLDCDSICLLEKGLSMGQAFLDISQLGDISQIYQYQYLSLKKKTQNEFFTRKAQQTKKQQEQTFEKNISNNLKFKTLYQKLKNQEDQKFSNSNPSQNKFQCKENQEEIKQFKPQDLGKNYKKVKLNQGQLISQNQQFFSYPFQNHFQQGLADYNFGMQVQNYQNYMFNLSGFEQNQMIKRESGLQKINITKKQVIQKIKQMCHQVYQRNKQSIMNYLETLKKSNIKWRVKDIEYFIFKYSSDLMNEIFIRQKLLHHMLLENQILKAKVGVMQHMAFNDLQAIKSNIMSMNRFLPEKFIVEKLKQNSLWTEQFNRQEEKPQLKQVKVIEVKQKEIQTQKKEKKLQVVNVTDRMMEEASEKMGSESLSDQCRFVPNVFNFSSPQIKQ